MNIAVIGGGAAGFFSAIASKENHPQANVVIFEKSQRILTKVKLSGGGRCNVTNSCETIDELCKGYPRGSNSLKKPFRNFNNQHAMEWFKKRDVPLMVQKDQRVFPASENSSSIIDCFLQECQSLDVKIEKGVGIKSITPEQENGKLSITFIDKKKSPQIFDKIIVATGGSSKKNTYAWLEALNHRIEEPVPSLFTFNMPKEPITKLMGVSVPKTTVTIVGTKLKSQDPILITHWGMSGPAILKLSAFGAKLLKELNYDFKVKINWVQEKDYEAIIDHLKKIIRDHPKKTIGNMRPYDLPKRLWLFLLGKKSQDEDKKWIEISKKTLNIIADLLANDLYSVNGKTTFKEEFVTCGGISLFDVDMNTMQSKICKNLYFAGEVLNIDGITGGYNFQAAWTTGYIAGQLK